MTLVQWFSRRQSGVAHRETPYSSSESARRFVDSESRSRVCVGVSGTDSWSPIFKAFAYSQTRVSDDEVPTACPYIRITGLSGGVLTRIYLS